MNTVQITKLKSSDTVFIDLYDENRIIQHGVKALLYVRIPSHAETDR